jgi:hypothetical protein
MTPSRLTLKYILAITTCLVIILAPLSLRAQGVGGVVEGAKQGVQKGAGAVEKGAEEGAQKTKEGAEAVGHGVQKAVTGEDQNTSDQRMKGSETTPGTQTQGTETTSTQRTQTGEKNLPKTAGELPLLALLGVLCLTAAVARRKRASNHS